MAEDELESASDPLNAGGTGEGDSAGPLDTNAPSKPMLDLEAQAALEPQAYAAKIEVDKQRAAVLGAVAEEKHENTRQSRDFHPFRLALFICSGVLFLGAVLLLVAQILGYVHGQYWAYSVLFSALAFVGGKKVA